MSHFGFYPVRQSGSHIILKNADGFVISIPRYDPLPEELYEQFLKKQVSQKKNF